MLGACKHAFTTGVSAPGFQGLTGWGISQHSSPCSLTCITICSDPAGTRRNLRNDLLVAADSITNTMSSLVKELHSGETQRFCRPPPHVPILPALSHRPAHSPSFHCIFPSRNTWDRHPVPPSHMVTVYIKNSLMEQTRFQLEGNPALQCSQTLPYFFISAYIFP